MRAWSAMRCAVAGALLLLLAGNAKAEPLKIRLGWVVVPANLAPILFAKEGVARHNGKSFTMEPVHFTGTPLMITALASGDLDIGLLAYSSFATAVENAGMSDLRVIADSFQDGVPGYYTNEYMVRQDSPIRSIADLKGKVLASNVAGAAVDVSLRAMLRMHGLDDKKDVTMIEVAFPNMKAMLGEKKVDLISAVTPFSMDPELRQDARTLFTQQEAVGKTEMIVYAAREGFLTKNRAAAVDFLEDMLRSLRWYTAPENHKEAVQIVANFTRKPPEYYEPWLFTKGGDYYRDPDGLPDLKALQANIDMERELGFLKAPMDVEKYADLALIKEAAGRIK